MTALNKAYYLLIPLLIVGIPYGFASFPLALFFLLPLLLFSNRHTVGFFLVMYGGPLGGCIRTFYPFLPVYGLLFELLGFVLIGDIVLDLIKNNMRSIWVMMFVLVIFGFFYLIGPKDDWASDKYINMCTHGLLMVVGYYAFDQSGKIETESLTQILLVTALCMFAFVIKNYNLSPGQLFDYNWFREQSLAWFYQQPDKEHMLISYQHIGMLVAFAIAIFLSQISLKQNRSLFYILCAMQMALVSGCRQAILAIVVIVVLRLVVFRSDKISMRLSISRIFGIIIVVMITGLFALFLLEGVGSSVISNTLTEGDNGRNLLFLEAISIFQDYPVFGSGIGGFHAITDNAWPHNFFLEMLSETGLVGTITMLFIIVITICKKHIGLLYLTNSKLFFFLVLMTLFVRVMVSSDLPESIELFSAIFAVGLSSPLRTKNTVV